MSKCGTFSETWFHIDKKCGDYHYIDDAVVNNTVLSWSMPSSWFSASQHFQQPSHLQITLFFF